MQIFISFSITGNGKIIPKGTDIFIIIQNLHRDEKVWKDPLRCVPERYLPENDEKRHPFTFLPFSYGPRNCIGKIITKYNEFPYETSFVTIYYRRLSMQPKERLGSYCPNFRSI